MKTNLHDIMNDLCHSAFVKNQRLYDIEAIRSASRKTQRVMDRKLCAVVLRQSGYTFDEIGKFLNRTHPTVLHLIRYCPWDYGMQITLPDPIDKKSIEKIIYYKRQIKKLNERIKQPIGV